MSLTYYVYGLACPQEGSVHYVGCSRQPTQRFEQHLAGGKNPSSDKDRWIASVLEKGLEPELLILQTIPHHRGEKPRYWYSDIDHREAERDWIRRLHSAGHPLTNRRVPTKKPSEQDRISRATERGREFVAALGADPDELLED